MTEHKIEASYLTVRGMSGQQVHRSVEIREGLMVDLNADGSVAGIERVGGLVGMSELYAVLAALPFEPDHSPAKPVPPKENRDG